LKRLVLPRLYVILDAALLTIPEMDCATSLADAGVRLLQYRNKTASTRKLYDSAQALATRVIPRDVTLVVNDRADVARLSGASGVHVGQEDLCVEAARSLVGESGLVGVSTHNLQQFQMAAESTADYIAVGPVFATQTKSNPDPVIGVDFIHRVRPMTKKPIVAIGGITLELATQVIEAGADSVAVISDILLAKDPAKRAAQYLKILGGEVQAPRA
jgi:thiamine-phosphate pyrophosphorylase